MHAIKNDHFIQFRYSSKLRDLNGNGEIRITYFSNNSFRTYTPKIEPPRAIIPSRFSMHPIFKQNKAEAIFDQSNSVVLPFRGTGCGAGARRDRLTVSSVPTFQHL